MTYIGDKGREIYETFPWTPATDDTPAENATLEGVYAKYTQYVAPMKNHIRAAVSFNRRKQDAGEKFDNFVTDLCILVKDFGYVEENRMLRDAIVLRSSRAAVREKCLEKGDDLSLNMANWYWLKLRDIAREHARYQHRRRSDNSCCEHKQIERTSTFV